MALVDPQKWKDVWNGLLPKSYLEVTNDHDIHERSQISASFYINRWLNPSWTEVYVQLYTCNQKSALEKVIKFVRPCAPGNCNDMMSGS